MAPNMAQPTVQRAIMNRHHQARRSNSTIAPKLEPGALLQSPQSRPTPPSHMSSPTSNSPGFHNPGVLTPPASDGQMHYAHQQRPQVPKPHPQHAMQAAPGLMVNTGGMPLAAKGQGSNGTASTGGTPTTAGYYPAGPFQNHIEQLGKLSRPFLSYFFAWNYVRPILIS